MKNINRLAYPQLLQQMQSYAAKENYRITRIWLKCIKHNHMAWAKAIEAKYPNRLSTKCDIVTAFGFSLMVTKVTKIE